MQRPYALLKARRIVDDVGDAVTPHYASGASHLMKRTTRAQAKRARVEAAPTWLKGRVEKEEDLSVVMIHAGKRPRVRVSRAAEVVDYAVMHMKKERFMELIDMMG